MPYGSLDNSAKNIVLLNPSLLIISVQLLRWFVGIETHVRPTRVTRKKTGGCIAVWGLSIVKKDEIRKFMDRIGFVGSKANRIEHSSYVL